MSRRRLAALLAVTAAGLAAVVVVVQPAWVVGLLARAAPSIVWRVPTRAPLAALSFDDGPHPVYTPRVLDILARERVRATFFLIGRRAQAHPRLLERIRREGHEVGNHTWTDGTTLWMDGREFEASVRRTQAVLATPRGRPRLFRPAGGLIRPSQLRAVQALGYRCVLGSAYAFDPYRPPSGYIRWAVARNLRPGAIAVLHDAGGDRSRTLAALPGILAAARSRGLRLVTVGELLASAGYHSPRAEHPPRHPR